MADYAALLDVEKKPASPQKGKTENPQAHKTTNQQTVLPAKLQEGKPASPQVGKAVNPNVVKPSNPQARKTIMEQVEKYTTRLEPSLIKRIKIYAAENDLADYEVVKFAVEEYLEKK